MIDREELHNKLNNVVVSHGNGYDTGLSKVGHARYSFILEIVDIVLDAIEKSEKSLEKD